MASSSKIQEVTETAPATQKKDSIEMNTLLGYIEQTQASGALSLFDAFIVHAAIRFLAGEEGSKEEFLAQLPEAQKNKMSPAELASNVIVTTCVRGQAKGAFSLADAAKLAKILKMVKAE